MDCLYRGYVFSSQLGLEAHFSEWHEKVSTELLYASYLGFVSSRRERHPMNREAIGRFMRKMGCEPKRLSETAVGEHLVEEVTGLGHRQRVAQVINHPRPPGYVLGDLDHARQSFGETTKLAVEWEPMEDLPRAGFSIESSP